MPNYRAAIVTPWVAAADDPSDSPSNHPQIGDDYQLLKWEDITGQPAENITPAPNEYTILVECTDTVLNAISVDSNYEILWDEEIQDAP